MREPPPIRLVPFEPGWDLATPYMTDGQGTRYYLEYFNGKEWCEVPIKGNE